MLSVVCLTCSTEFEAQRASARYCSRSCQPSHKPRTEAQKDAARERNRRYYQRLKAERPEVLAEKAARDNEAARERGWPTAQRYRQAHPDLVRERTKRWQEANPETYSAVRLTSRFKAKGGDYSDMDRIDLISLFARDEGRCGICGEDVEFDAASVDHIKPVSAGGAHKWGNVQLAHIVCNSRKGDRYGAE